MGRNGVVHPPTKLVGLIVEIPELSTEHLEALKGRTMVKVLLQTGRAVFVLEEQLEVLDEEG